MWSIVKLTCSFTPPPPPATNESDRLEFLPCPAVGGGLDEGDNGGPSASSPEYWESLSKSNKLMSRNKNKNKNLNKMKPNPLAENKN